MSNASILNLTAIPQGLAENLGIPEFAGGILASVILLTIVMLPIAMYERRGIYGKLFVGIGLMGFCIAISWLPTYFLILVAVMIALMLSGRAMRWISG